MRRVAGAFVLGLLALTTLAASGPEGAAGRTSVAAAFFPLAEAARHVGGRHVRVSDLTPAGVEPHDFELSSDDVDRLLDAELAIVMGDDFQPAVEATADDRDGPTLVVFDELRRTRLLGSTSQAPSPPASSGKATRRLLRDDPHIWLDPVRYRAVVVAVADALVDVDPEHARSYRANAARYGKRLAELDRELARGLADCESRTIVSAHEAFGWLADRYDLVQHGIAGIEPDTEPDPQRLAELADLAEREGVTTVFTETLVSPRVARTVAREAGGLRTAVLDPLEGLDDDRRDAGADYVSVMRDNMRELRTALRCT